MMTPVQSPPQWQSVRFGDAKKKARRDDAAMQRLRASIAGADNLLDEVVYVNVNQPRPDTPLSRARQKIGNGIRTALLVLALAAASIPGIAGVVSARASQPNATTVACHNAISDSWDDLRVASRVADNNTQAQANFNLKIEAFLNTLVNATACYAPEDAGLMSQLQEELRRSGDYNAPVVAHQVGIDLINYVEQDLRLPPDPSERQLNAAFAHFEADFINRTPALATLSPQQKADFTQAVIRIVDAAMPGQLGLNAFDNLVLGYIGDASFAGEKLSDFKALQGEDDAKRLLRSVISNPENFSELNANERQSFLDVALAAADTLEYPRQGYLLWGLLTLVALGGAAALAVIKRQALLELPGALGDVKDAQPVLVITNVDRRDKDSLSELLRLEDQIDQSAQAMEQMLKATMEDSPAIRDFLTELFGAGRRLPDAAWFRERHTRQAAREVLQSLSAADRAAETPQGELALKRRLAVRLDSAMRSGEILLVENTADLETQAPNPALPVSQQIEQELTRVETLIAASLKFFCNRKFAEAGAVLHERKLSRRHGELEDRMIQLQGDGQKPVPGSELSHLLDEHARLAAELPVAQLRVKEARRIAHEAQKTINEYVEPLRDYRLRLVRALNDADFNQSVEDLRKVRDAAGELKPDPRLEEALHQQRVEAFVREQQEASRRIEEEVNAEVARELARLQQPPSLK